MEGKRVFLEMDVYHYPHCIIDFVYADCTDVNMLMANEEAYVNFEYHYDGTITQLGLF